MRTTQSSAATVVEARNAEKSTGHSPIRVVRIIDRLNVGGPAKHAVWLSSGLQAGAFETTLITGTVPEGEGDMTYFAAANHVEPVVIPEMSREISARDLIVILKLISLLLRLKPDIIHTHKAKAGAVGRLAAVIYKWLTPSTLWFQPRTCRILHTYHGHVFHGYFGPIKTRVFIAIERVLARFCDSIIVLSDQQRREICETYRVGLPDQFRVVPLGIDLDEIDEAGGRPFEKQRGEVLVGTVGRLCEIKNYGMLIEAAGLGAQLTPQLRSRYVVVGDGHLRSKLEEHARELGVYERFTFTGFRSDAPSLYAGMDIVALTSLNEGTPLTLIEAMACGRPVVATEVGGVVDIMGERRSVHDGFAAWDHGVTVRPKDSNAFARALSFLFERSELRREMGRRGRAFIRDKHSKNRLINRIEGLYRELAGTEVKSAPSSRVQAVARSR